MTVTYDSVVVNTVWRLPGGFRARIAVPFHSKENMAIVDHTMGGDRLFDERLCFHSINCRDWRPRL